MLRRLSTYARLALALVVLLTSQQMAIARGSPAAAGTMVICGGQGIVTITVDAEGNPTGAVHICPDCAMSFFAFDGGMPVSLAVSLRWEQVKFQQDFLRIAPQFRVRAQARAPPVFV